MSQMPEVDCKHGAPMGRLHGIAKLPTGKVRLFRVKLDSGGYDDGGAYWGLGERLYCATDDADFTHYLRAPDRWEASYKFQDEIDARRKEMGLPPGAIAWKRKVSE